MIADGQLSHTGTDLFHDPRALVSEHDRILRWQMATEDRKVCTTHPRGDHSQAHFALARVRIVELLDFNVPHATADGGLHHVILPPCPESRSVEATSFRPRGRALIARPPRVRVEPTAVDRASTRIRGPWWTRS